MEKIYSTTELQQILYPVFADTDVERAMLFGSYAKGSATANSDVDIVIDSNGKLLDIRFFTVVASVEKALGKNVDMYEVKELKPGSPVLNALNSEGIILYDRSGAV